MAGFTPDDAVEMLEDAALHGADTSGSIDPDTMQALLDKRRMQSILDATKARQAQIVPPADAYTETNHGLGALPPVDHED